MSAAACLLGTEVFQNSKCVATSGFDENGDAPLYRPGIGKRVSGKERGFKNGFSKQRRGWRQRSDQGAEKEI